MSTQTQLKLGNHPVSWSALSAGVILTFAMLLLFGLMHAGCSDKFVRPMLLHSSLLSVGMMASCWLALNLLLSVSAGGFLSGLISRKNGLLHGLLVWSVTLLLLCWSCGPSLTGYLGLQMMNKGPQIALEGAQLDATGHFTTQRPYRFARVQQELELILNPAEAGERTTSDTIERAQHRTKAVALSSEAVRASLMRWLDQVSHHNAKELQLADRNGLRNLLRELTDYSDKEIAAFTQRIQQIYKTEYPQVLVEEAKTKRAHERSDRASAKQLEGYGWKLFFSLAASAAAAMAAGRFGAKTQTLTQRLFD